MRRRTNKPLMHKHTVARVDAHVHVPHITHWTNLPWIRRLCLWVFLECSTLYPLIYCRPSPPPHQNTVCLSLSVSSVVCLCVCGLRLGCPDPPQLRLYKPCVPKAAHWAHHSGPPSLKRCCLTGLTSPSLQESLFVSQLASCCILAIWHRRDALTASNKQLLLTVNNAIPGNDSPFGYFCSLSLIKETFL